VFDFGCPACGAAEFHDGSGMRIGPIAPHEPGEPVSVKRRTPDKLATSDTVWLSNLWSCANNHQVPPSTGLWFALEVAAVLPDAADPMPLPKNA
jgi:hypothetical protein